MHISSVRDLGIYVRDRRKAKGWTQSELAGAAGVSLRWLSDLEGGKSTAEIGLIFRALHALGLAVEVQPMEKMQGGVDLDDLLNALEVGNG